MKLFSRRAEGILNLLFFFTLLFGGIGAYADPVKENPQVASRTLPTPQLLNQVSVLVLSFDLLSDQGVSFHHPFAQFLERQFNLSNPQSLANLIISRGGHWEIIESVRKVQVGLFLPVPPAEAEEITLTFLKHVQSALSEAQTLKPVMNLPQQVIARLVNQGLITGPPKTARVSFWLTGPIEAARPRIREEVSSFSANLAFPALGEAGNAELKADSPTIVSLAVWNKPSAGALASARFLGEHCTNKETTRFPWYYDVWEFSDKIVLAVVATAPLTDLYAASREGETFFHPLETASDTLLWQNFLHLWTQNMQAESRLLEKGAFLKAFEESCGFAFAPADSSGFIKPDRTLTLAALPDERLRTLICQNDSNPRMAIAQVPTLQDRVDINIGLFLPGEKLQKLASALGDYPLISHGEIETSKVFPDFLFLHLDLSPQEVVPVMGNLRSFLYTELFQSHLASSTTGPNLSILPEKPQFIIVGVGSLPAYELYGKIRSAWPPEPATGLLKGSPDPKALLRALEFPPAETISPETFKGRWAIQTSTPAGLGKVFTKLLAQSIPLEEVKEVFSTLKMN